MQTITLEQLLEAGCHFGHKSERWHPKASEFIWQEKDGIHIIDLAKTKAGLDSAMAFVERLGQEGGTLLMVGCKRQARGVVEEAAKHSGANYLVQRWIGGFLTNWEGVHKNIKKINNMMADQASGAWKRMGFPKHEQTKLARYLKRLNVDYVGVLTLDKLPSALLVVDVRKEQTAVREALRVGIPIIGIVDTNANPQSIDYVIPSNDDAVGAVQFIVNAVGAAFRQGREKFQKDQQKAVGADAPQKAQGEPVKAEQAPPAVTEEPASAPSAQPVTSANAETAAPAAPADGEPNDKKTGGEKPAEAKKKRGRPKKTVADN